MKCGVSKPIEQATDLYDSTVMIRNALVDTLSFFLSLKIPIKILECQQNCYLEIT